MRPIFPRRAAVVLVTAAGLLGGCTAPAPVIREGNADTVQVGYGGDIASAWPLARRHCAQYERVPQLVEAGADIAVFDCTLR